MDEHGRRTRAGRFDDEGNFKINCPICLAEGTRISTPSGGTQIEDLTVGSSVFSRDEEGRRITVRVLSVGATPATNHQVVALRLRDGRELFVSPDHPSALGERVADLEPGDTYDGSAVSESDLIPYTGGRTLDIEIEGPTAIYWANGIPMRSTLVRTRGR